MHSYVYSFVLCVSFLVSVGPLSRSLSQAFARQSVVVYKLQKRLLSLSHSRRASLLGHAFGVC